MSRTTLDIADPILGELKQLQAAEGKSLGQLVTELVAEALAGRRRTSKVKAAPLLRWHSADMGRAKVDIDDKDALWAVLDARDSSK